jgi:hypothetical protein
MMIHSNEKVVGVDISIDTDDERCPKCDTIMIDDDVVAGWVWYQIRKVTKAYLT